MAFKIVLIGTITRSPQKNHALANQTRKRTTIQKCKNYIDVSTTTGGNALRMFESAASSSVEQHRLGEIRKSLIAQGKEVTGRLFKAVSAGGCCRRDGRGWRNPC